LKIEEPAEIRFAVGRSRNWLHRAGIGLATQPRGSERERRKPEAEPKAIAHPSSCLLFVHDCISRHHFLGLK